MTRAPAAALSHERECLLDRKVPITWFESLRAFRSAEYEFSPRDIARLAKTTRMPSKGSLPMLSPGVYGDERSKKGSLRTLANLKKSTWLACDYDGPVNGDPIEMREFAEKLKAHDIVAVLYETPSHVDGDPRWRGLLPPSKALDPNEFYEIATWVNGLSGGELDQGLFDRSRAYFIGSLEGKPPVRTILVDGSRYIDQCDDLSVLGLDKRGRTRRDYDLDDTTTQERLEIEWEDFADAVSHVSNDGRRPEQETYEWWLTMGASIHHQSEGSAEGLELFMKWAAEWKGNDPDKNEKTWDSFDSDRKGRAITGRYAVRLAQNEGWFWKDAVSDIDVEAEFEDISGEPGVGVPEPRQREGSLRFRSADEAINSPDAFDFVERFLFAGQISMWYGAPEAAKTFILLDLAARVALGWKWRSCRTAQGIVLYISLEGADMHKRLRAWCQHNDIDAKHLPIVLADGSFRMRKDKATRKAVVQQVKKAEADWGLPVHLIVVDTLSRALGGGESDDEAVGGLIDAAKMLSNSTGAHIAFVHHPGKDASKGLRGHSSLLGNSDTEVLIERESDVSVVRVTRQKEVRRLAPVAFELREIGLGYENRWGTESTSCVVVPADPPEQDVKLTSNEAEALKILQELRQPTNEIGKPIGALRTSVPVKEWRAAGTKLGALSAHENPDARRMAMNRAITGLCKKGQVRIIDVSGTEHAVVEAEVFDPIGESDESERGEHA